MFPSPPSLVTFSLLAVVLIVTPGADTMLLLRNAVSGGRTAAVATALGSRLGLVVHAILAGLGVSALLAASAQAFQVLKLAGAVYLVWLGLKSVAHAAGGSRATTESTAARRDSRPWVEGFLTNLLNPKTIAFYLAVLPQFIQPHHDPAARALLLAAVHILLSLIWYIGLALLIGGTQRLLAGGRVPRAFEAGGGAVLIGFGLRLALERG